jgi:MFS family permease
MCASALPALVAARQLALQYFKVHVLTSFPRALMLLLLRTGIGGSFYLGYSWLPSFFVAHAGISTMTSLWMVLTSMVLFTFIVPVAGYLSDKGQPRVTATIAICAIAGATSVPMFLAFQTGNLAACWLLQAFSLAMTAYTMGILPQICSLIYPAGVRISGFNLGYNLGEKRWMRSESQFLKLQIIQARAVDGSRCACCCGQGDCCTCTRAHQR